ncbi:MAG TPA: YceI family protein [Cryomorphaceae bacterium]|nr:YceI family protein [Cryomorphaceae bacterium]
MKLTSKHILLFAIALSIAHFALSQTHRVANELTAVTVVGTSSLHDWESDVEEVSGSGTFKMTSGQVSDIRDLNVIFRVKSIESGKSKMNELTYEAFDADNHPNIKFEITNVLSIEGNHVKARGKLSMAGQSKVISPTGLLSVSGNSITIKGSEEIDMTEYGMETPTAMFGAIKVGKTVIIEYEVTFK